MCGIVGLFIKNPEFEARLGSMLCEMLEEMTSRGPDSAGFALYGAGAGNRLKTTLLLKRIPHRTFVSGAAGYRFVVLNAFIPEAEVVHGALRRGHDAKRAIKRFGYALRGFDITGDYRGRVARV